MPDYRLDIRLQEPFSSGPRPVVSNEIDTVEFIPATSLRGALASELHYSGRATELGAWFGLAGPQWTPALPACESPTGDVVPMPLCLSREKGDAPFHGCYPVYNTLYAAPPYADASQRLQWSPIRAPWLRITDGQPSDVHRLTVESSMHVGLHYGRQANRSSALFSRREVASRTRFVAWVRDPQSVLTDPPGSLTVGKRRSAGNGSALVTWKESPFPWLGRPVDRAQDTVNLQLITDTVVPNPATGGYYRGLDSDAWSTLLGVPTRVVASASASRLHRTWSGVWGLPRSQTLAIAAGSAFRLAPATPAQNHAFHLALARLAESGLGLARHEGFGWVAVNPSWLVASQITPKDLPSERRLPGPQMWPGFDESQRDLLLQALTQAHSVKENLMPNQLALANALAHFAARANSAEDVRTYLSQVGQRSNPHGWNHLHQSLEGPLASFGSNFPLLRFFLQALETKPQ